MKKYVVVSTNNNADYMFYAPYVERAWNKLGWSVAFMVTHDVNPLDLNIENPKDTLIIQFPFIPGIRIETQAQASRLYAAHFLPSDCLIMTSDIDLIPMSDYWNPDPEKITVFGHDLTDHSYIPMGYVAMTAPRWKEVMKLTHDITSDFVRDAGETKLPYSENWEKWWNHDWQLLTNRLKPLYNEITFVTRGRRLTGTYAYGRVDRGDGMKVPPGETLIDMHCENHNVQHPDKLGKFLAIYEPVYGKI